MRFGMLHYSYGSVDEVVNLAKLAEEKNFESYWIPEVGLPRDLYVVLTHMISNTKSIVLGPETNPYTRHPAITANALATLDEISGGRVALMIGSGHEGYLRQVGIQHHSESIAFMKSAIQICRGVWSGKRFNYDGVGFKIKNLKISYEFQKDIPIILADNDQEMLRLAGPYADGVCINLTPLKYLPGVWEYTKKGLAESGRDISDFRFYFQPLIAIAKDRDEAKKAVEKIILHSLFLVHNHDALRESIGLEKEDLTPAVGASMKEMAKSAGELEFATVKCAPIILKILKPEVADRLLDETTIYGTVEDVIEKLKAYEKVGVRDVLIGLVPYPNPFATEISEYIKLIGEEIIPQFEET